MLVAVIIPFLVFSLSTAHYQSLLKAKETELDIMSYVLISGFSFNNGNIDMPKQVLDERLNILESGYQGYIRIGNQTIWQSQSITTSLDQQYFADIEVGMRDFREILVEKETYFVSSFAAEYESNDRFLPVKFYIINHGRDLNAQHSVFTRTLWNSAVGMGVVVGFMLLLSLLSVVLPINTLIEQLKLTRQGKQQQIEGDFPKELYVVKRTINDVLEEEQQQRQRFQNALHDLAHTLKTPLSVIKGDPELPTHLDNYVMQIDNIIQRQLIRAKLGQSGTVRPIELCTGIKKIANSMQKIHREKGLEIDTRQVNTVIFPFNEIDWFELAGNIIDNACKAADKYVTIALYKEDDACTFVCYNDGKSIPVDLQQSVLKRGVRLDNYKQGSGLGLAIVNDIIAMYDGTISFEDTNAPVFAKTTVRIAIPLAIDEFD